MNSNIFTRRDFSVRMATFFSGLGIAGIAFPSRIGASEPGVVAQAASGDEISHSAEAIHMEVSFKASRKRVYDALTDTAQFDKVVQLSAAVKSGMALGNKPTAISREVGGGFTLYGGYITGRHLDLVPNERIVQAWRSASWHPGDFSIARFDLKGDGSDTRLTFDHRGFPNGAAASLLEGWNENYWEPLKKALA
ncbi:MAG: SRPBCC domain-containing protein [Candidatus Acidiferrales bacterium]